MQCKRLITLIKSWYINVKDETMAPARMVSFIKEHTAECEVCLADPGIHAEIEKITEIVLPESKIPKAVRLAQEKENSTYEDDESSNSDETDTDEDDDTDVDEDSDATLDENLDDEI